MVVRHNLMAMNSNRMLGLTSNSQAKSTEKLSSGYKINRAADDAAGLAISEKMRKQIRGLSQAALNAQDGISAVQTAEGALNEVQDMLQRMNELAVKASNGTMSEDDRSHIQDEIDQLITEIDRVSETTKFNETYLLKGDGESPASEEIKYKDLGADRPITAKLTDAAGKRITTTTTTGADGRTELNLGDLENIKVGDSITIDGQTYVFAEGDSNTDASIDNRITLDFAADTDGLAAGTAPTADQIAQAIVAEIQGKNDALYVAAPNTGAVETVAMLKDKDGNYILTLQSRTDVNRVNDAGNTDYKTAEGAVFTSAAGVIADGQEIVLGEVKLVGTMTDKTGASGTGTDAEIADTDYSINLDKYEGEEMSLVYDAADSVWTATSPTGKTATYTTKELQDMGIGIQKGTDDTTFVGLDNAKGYTLADGFTLKIEKDVVAPLTADPLVASSNLEGVDLSNYKVGDSVKVVANVTSGGVVTFSNVDPVEKGIKALNFSLQVGADTSAQNKISVDIEAMSAEGLGIEGVRVDGKDSSNADAAVDVIADAIQKVSKQRSALGAVQNRLEHTIANLDNVVENTTAAESQIRDTDMATEMVKFSNSNILAQAGQAMLAQANQSNQGVLSLLG